MLNLKRLLLLAAVASALLMANLFGDGLLEKCQYLGWRIYFVWLGVNVVACAAVLTARSLLVAVWPSLDKLERSGGQDHKCGNRWRSWKYVFGVTFVVGSVPATIIAMDRGMSKAEAFVVVTVSCVVTYLIQLPILLGWRPW